MTNSEFRKAAWARLWSDRWFWRLFIVGVLLNFIGRVMLTAVVVLFGSGTVGVWALVFFAFLMAGIIAYGHAAVLLKCIKNDEQDYLKDAFVGFKMPLGLCGMAVQKAVLSILGLFIVPFYRYRFLFLIKVEHPDWTCGECFAASRKLMKGRKWASFKLDCSYWKPICASLISWGILVIDMVYHIDWNRVFEATTREEVVEAFSSAMSVHWILLYLVVSTIVKYYISVGQALFYRETIVSTEHGNLV